MASRKLEHLNEQIRQKLSLILQRESDDPRFRHVTVTAVRVTRDLASARVTYSTYDALMPAPARTAAPRGKAPRGRAKPKQKPGPAATPADLTRALNRAAGHFAHALARSLETRISPKLEFVYDPTFDRLQEMENLLKPLREAGAMGTPDAEGAAEGGPDAAASGAEPADAAGADAPSGRPRA